jgi:hypothetical protein
MTELFLKINEYNIADDFTKSVESNYNKNKKISPKQIACLNRKIWQYEKAQNLINEIQSCEDIKMKSQFESIKDQFEQKKFVSPKQVEYLTIIHRLSKPAEETYACRRCKVKSHDECTCECHRCNKLEKFCDCRCSTCKKSLDNCCCVGGR